MTSMNLSNCSSVRTHIGLWLAFGSLISPTAPFGIILACCAVSTASWSVDMILRILSLEGAFSVICETGFCFRPLFYSATPMLDKLYELHLDNRQDRQPDHHQPFTAVEQGEPERVSQGRSEQNARHEKCRDGKGDQ